MRLPTLCIDLGSANTKIYQIGTGVVLNEPSVIAINESGKRKVKATGIEAKRLIGKTVSDTEVFSPVFEGNIEDELGATLMLETFLNKVTLKKLGKRPNVLFAVPCGAENASIKRFEKTLNDCDVFGIHFVESPVLTALGMGIPLTEASPCFIIDIGGGSTKIAAVSLGGVISGISVNMGGRSIDKMLIEFIDSEYGLRIGSLTAESLKIQIGSLLQGDLTNTTVRGRDVSTGQPRAITLNASEIYEPIKTFFDKIFQLASMVMAKLPAEISAEIRRSGVYFAGGTSKIIGLTDYFRYSVGIKANTCEDPELATAVGAGIVAGNEKLLRHLAINRR